MIYSKTILDRFQNPRNAGQISGANAVGEAGNAACGDVVKLFLKISENGIIENAKFKTFGCSASIASSDVACDLIKGRNIDDALKVTSADILKILGELPAHKIHSSLLAEEVIRLAISDYYKRKEKATKAAIRKSKKAL